LTLITLLRGMKDALSRGSKSVTGAENEKSVRSPTAFRQEKWQKKKQAEETKEKSR